MMATEPLIPAATLVTFSALTLFPFPLERVYSTVSPSSKLSKSPHISLRGNQMDSDLDMNAQILIPKIKKSASNSSKDTLAHTTPPVVKENLLVMICCLNEAKVVLQCGNKTMQSLGIGGIAIEDPDGDCTLLASSLHFTDGELHLRTNILKWER